MEEEKSDTLGTIHQVLMYREGMCAGWEEMWEGEVGKGESWEREGGAV